MARQRVEKNISYDAKRKLYYVTLYYGNVDGKPQKETETFSTKREAREARKFTLDIVNSFGKVKDLII